MKILKENKKKSLMWKFAAAFIFMLSLVITYWYNLNLSFNGHNNSELNIVQSNLESNATFQEGRRDVWNENQKLIQQNIEDCRNADIADGELKKCKEKLESLKKEYDIYDSRVIDLDLEEIDLKIELKSLR